VNAKVLQGLSFVLGFCDVPLHSTQCVDADMGLYCKRTALCRICTIW